MEHFRSLSYVTYRLQKGVNLLTGEATDKDILDFIAFLFYGCEEGHTEKGACGSAVFETTRGRYRIERYVGHTPDGAEEICRVTDLSTELPLDGDFIPGEYFFGVPRSVFLGTLPAADPPQRVAALRSLLFSGAENTDPLFALEDMKRLAEDCHNEKGSGKMDLAEQELDAFLRSQNDREAQRSGRIARVHTLNEAKLQLENNTVELARCNELYDRIVAVAALRQFLILDRKQKEKEQALQERQAWDQQNTANGFLPDAAYLGELQEARSGLQDREELLAELEEQEKEKAPLTMPEKEGGILQTVSHKGGEDFAVKELHFLRTKVSKRRKRALRFSLYTLLAAALTLCVFLVPLPWVLGELKAVRYACPGVSALLSLLTLWFLTHTMAREARALYRTYGADTCTEAEEAIRQALSVEGKVRESERAYADYRAALDGKKTELLAARENARILLARWGRAYEGCSGIDDTIAAGNLYLEKKAEAERNVAAAEQSYNRTASPLAGFQRHAVEDTITRTAHLGDVPAVPSDELILKRNFYDRKQKALIQQISAMEQEVSSHEIGLPVDEDTAMRTLLTNRLEETRKQYQACLLAIKGLTEATNTYRRRTLPPLSQMASALLTAAMGSRQNGLGLEATLSLPLEEAGTAVWTSFEKTPPATRSLIYTAVHLASLRLTYGEKLPPALLREPLANVTGERRKQMAALIGNFAGNGQVLIFTPCPEERELFGTDYHACTAAPEA